MKIITGFLQLYLSMALIRNYCKKCINNTQNQHHKPVEQHPFIISNNKQKTGYKSNDGFLKDHSFINEKKLISISPGGLYGFYFLGVITYLKENYNLNNYVFTGASAGSWASLAGVYKGDPQDIIQSIDCKNLSKIDSLLELKYSLKYKLMNKFNTHDFDFKRLFIGVSTIRNFKIITNIFTDFENLEDAISACISSSFIPFITGSFRNKYRDLYGFDGGFSPYPYLNLTNIPHKLHITKDMYIHKPARDDVKPLIQKIREFKDTTTLFSFDKFDFIQLYKDGYEDSQKNKDYLDDIFKDDKLTFSVKSQKWLFGVGGSGNRIPNIHNFKS